MTDNKLSQLLGDYRSDDSESDEPACDAGKRKMCKSSNDIVNEIETKSDTDWTQCIDKNTGHPYYWNIVTKEVTWEIPEDYERFLRQNVIDSSKRSAKNTWILCQGDDQSEYYFNEFARAISWDKPAGYVEQQNIEEHGSVQQVRGHKFASRQTKSERTPKENAENIQSANNNNECSISASSSSGETEPRNKAERNTVQNVCSINLVPEYNSDEDDTDNEVDNHNNQSATTIDSSKMDNSNDAPNNLIANLASTEESKSMQTTKSMSSFASIIVGGRSPTHDSQNLLTPDAEASDSGSITADLMAIEREHLSQKQFKRKRRIEFSFNHKRDANPPENSGGTGGGGSDKDGNIVTVSEENCSNNSTELTITSTKLGIGNLYENFQRESTGDSQQKTDRKSADPEQHNDVQKTAEEISQLKDILEAKLKFLCQGHNDVELKPVQVMHIQLQTLFEAHTVNALHSEYLLSWLNNVSSDLFQLETDAAPTGWKCVWNRNEAKYCYENLETGSVQYAYPDETNQNEIVRDDDEMDICTTPPPPSIIDEPSNIVESRSFVPEPPNWNAAKVTFIKKQNSTGEPLPPGIDPSEQNETPMDNELATFYSDIASLDQTGATSMEPSTNHSNDTNEKTVENTIDNNSDTTEEKKKKKRKKQKQLEPWRSGNLETWINKWQKAQKELDG